MDHNDNSRDCHHNWCAMLSVIYEIAGWPQATIALTNVSERPGLSVKVKLHGIINS